MNLVSRNQQFVVFNRDIVKQITWKEGQQVVELVDLLAANTVQ